MWETGGGSGKYWHCILLWTEFEVSAAVFYTVAGLSSRFKRQFGIFLLG
jgi:hypothetical protein